MKKISLLFLLLLLPLLSLEAKTYQGANIGGIHYALDFSDRTAKVSNNFSTKYTGSVYIPSSVTYDGTIYIVTTILSGAFMNCLDLTYVSIPNSVTSIDSYAFENCSALTYVYIPYNITSIADDVFIGCSNLTKIIINNNNIVSKTYSSSSSLNEIFGKQVKEYVLGEKVTSLGSYAFSGCSDLISISIANSVNSIGNEAFSGCSNLAKITLNSNNIVSRTYSSSSSLKEVFGKQVKEYILGENVTSIGNYAFFGCSDLTSVTIPSSVISIGTNAFSGCYFEKGKFINNSNLDAENNNYWGAIIVDSKENGFVIKDGVLLKYEGNESSVTIPNSVTSIGCSAFSGCSSLTSVEIPNSVTSIRESAFYGCSALTSVTIPNSVVSIGSKTFYGCSGLKSVEIPHSVTSMGEDAFNGCINLTSVIIPNNVTEIRSRTFRGCSRLKSVTFSNKVRSLGNSAFRNCSSLTSITIPESVTSIENYAFDGCSDLTKVILNSNSIVAKTYDSYYALKSIFGSQVREYILGNNVSSIGNYAFYYCSNLTSFTIPNSVISIGSKAFYGCSGLTSVTIPNSVTSIGSYAFQNCSGLTSITIPNSVTEIGEDAFATTYLGTLVIGTGVLSIGSSTFSGRPAKTIWLTNTPPQGYMNLQGDVNYVANSQYGSMNNKKEYKFLSSMFEVDGIIYVPVSPSERTCDAIDCVYNESAEKINIGEKVTNKGVSLTVKQVCPYTCYGNIFIKDVNLSFTGDLGDNAFYGCTKLSDIIIPDSVTSIGGYAFDDCFSLSFAKIGSGVKAILLYTFSGCSSLKDVQIGKNVKSIGGYAFNGCSTLPKIQIPQSVTSIDNYVFKGCTRLKTVIMDNGDSDLSLSSNGSNPLFTSCPLDSVYIGRNITYNTSSSYGYSPFYRNTSLRTVVITDKETEISDNEFYGCTNLQSFKVGDGVTKFGKYAFSGCSSLNNLSFGTKLQSIGQEAFSDCVAITSIVSKATTPPVCGSQALDDISKWDCVLYVPEGTISTYQAADQWKEFFFVEEGDPFAILRGDANGDGVVNMDDATFVTNIILGTEEATEAADVNNDGVVNMPDVMFIINYIKNGKFPDE